MTAIPNRAAGHTNPVDSALLAIRDAVHVAVEAGAPRSLILGEVANGLTGDLNGYRERLLTTHLGHVADRYADLSQADAKVIEDHARGRAS